MITVNLTNQRHIAAAHAAWLATPDRPETVGEYVQAAMFGARLRGNGKLMPVAAEMPARNGARRSAVANRDLPAGMWMSEEYCDFLRPGDGLPPGYNFAARRLAVPVEKGTVLQEHHFGVR